MDCVVCEKPSGYNRVVVDAERGTELGGLCTDCELRKLGELGAELGDPESEACALCDRDAFWRLPKWLPSTYEADGKTVSYVDYDAASAALALCDEHLTRLGADIPAGAVADRPARPTRRVDE